MSSSPDDNARGGEGSVRGRTDVVAVEDLLEELLEDGAVERRARGAPSPEWISHWMWVKQQRSRGHLPN